MYALLTVDNVAVDLIGLKGLGAYANDMTVRLYRDARGTYRWEKTGFASNAVVEQLGTTNEWQLRLYRALPPNTWVCVEYGDLYWDAHVEFLNGG